MNKFFLTICLIVFTSLSGSAWGCTFSFHVYGPTPVNERIAKKIGEVVTDEYCNKYNKKYEIVFFTDVYTNETRSLAHVAVGIRSRKTEDIPANRRTAYSFKDGNYVIAKAYDLAAEQAIDSLMDVMSTLKEYVPKQ